MGMCCKNKTDWVKKCMEYEGEGPDPEVLGIPKSTWKQVVQKDCQTCRLNREDAMDHSIWTKLINDG